MTEVDKIKAELARVRFTSFRDYTASILGALRIPRTTVERLLSKAALDLFKRPVIIYRRAIIIYRAELKGSIDLPVIKHEINEDEVSACRLLLVISRDLALCEDLDTELVIEFKPERISQHVHFFFPLIYGTKSQKDLETTVEFSELVGELYTRLCLDDKNPYAENRRELAAFVLTLIYLAFSSSILKNNELKNTLAWAKPSNTGDYRSIISDIFDAILRNHHHGESYKNLPHWEICSGESTELPYINQEAFKLVSQILSYDLASLDGEVLGSLIYKLVKRDDEQSVYGHSISYRLVSKALKPLFVTSYAKEIESSKGDVHRLRELRDDLLTLKFFDPTNGPGCFLTSALNSVIDLIASIDALLFADGDSPTVDLANFIGLVDNEISQGLSRLSLWTAYLQHLRDHVGVSANDLHTTYERVRVHCGDPLAIDWNTVCPNNGKTLIIGSPTFKGKIKFTVDDRRRMRQVFGADKLGDADFCSCWLYRAAQYLRASTSKCSLVLTNSICQGSQVPSIWKRIESLDCEISFAHRSLKLRSQNQPTTGITVIVIGLSSPCNSSTIKHLFVGDSEVKTHCIGPYLIDSTRTIVEKSRKPLSSQLPPMPRGNMPYDNGHLLLAPGEKDILLRDYPSTAKFLKKIVGSEEFIDHAERWCLWISDEQRSEAMKISPIAGRVDKVQKFRLASTDKSVQKMAERPHQFREFRSPTRQTLVIPIVSSENRPYIPIGFIGEDTVVSNLAFTIFNCPTWVFGVVSSRMHMAWIRTVCGALETRLRYSTTLGYNTFIFPEIPEIKQRQIEALVMEILSAREEHCDKSLGQLYSALPPNLISLHGYLDDCIDQCYKEQPFVSDIERVRLLFELYERHRD